jgi:molybdate transport system substrate-binding protein
MGKSSLRLVALALLLASVIGISAAQADTVTVFAAASLKNALDEIATNWKASGGSLTAISYASSSTLAKQIEQAAPADVFISADEQWMDYLIKKSMVETPHDLLANTLVLIANKANPIDVDIKPGFDLVKLLGEGRLAVGDPSNVPAGIYAKEALGKLGLWAAVEPKLAPAADVRGALALVSRDEAPYGIVYGTDATIDPNVRIVGVFPEDSHAPIHYPVAHVTSGKSADAAKFIAYLATPAAKTVFEHYGFVVLTTK